MAYATGTATDQNDLWVKLRSFLTTNSALVAAGQQWSQAWGSSNAMQYVMRGPGLTGTDQIYVGIKLVSDIAADRHWIELRGLTGVAGVGSASDIADHANPSSAKRMFLDSAPMKYWFVASGRRFVVVVRCGGGVYEAMYGGLFTPYAPPAAYPYPLFIGGSAGAVLNAQPSWRAIAAGHAAFPYSTITPTDDASADTLDPLGQWRTSEAYCTGADDNSLPYIGIGPANFFDGAGADKVSSASRPGYDSLRQCVSAAYGGSYVLNPITLTQRVPGDQTYGILDGCFEVSGYQQHAEDTITVSGVTHLVLQDTYRADRGRFWAIALE